jgi:hypothetical protein
MRNIIAVSTLMTMAVLLGVPAPAADQVLLETESFQEKGGWQVDQQFIHIMGSPYLLAHGMGIPVANAKTMVEFPSVGEYRVWVRTKNWVPGSWEAPGRFQLIVGGKTLDKVFGTEPGWKWQDGGKVEIAGKKCPVELKDLTGFDGRCDAVYFTKDMDFTPPNVSKEMMAWRDGLLGIPAEPKSSEAFDLVVVGGGIAGCAACLAADRQGLKVALVHDRPVLGGNASGEVRVHTEGIHGKSAEILTGLDTKHWPNGSADAIPDTEKRQKTMDAAKGVKQFLCWRAYAVNMDGNRIKTIDAKHIETAETKRFAAPLFIDCTGDGWIGVWAGAEHTYGREPSDKYGETWDKHGELWSPNKPDNRVMGSSVLWNSKKTDEPSTFPEVPWAMDVAKDKAAINGEWYWEYSSNDKHQIKDAEEIRDHMLRAIYGSFSNAKKNPTNSNVRLQWVAHIAGKRESVRLAGDYVYTQKDAVSNTYFPDTVVEETRAIDVHHQQNLSNTKPCDYDFLSTALFMKTGMYYIPFRCLYSKNISNLMMAGRCFSCSHVGLGGPRVMNTTGQMGVATGYAAALCRKYNTDPRGVYKDHIDELRKLIGYTEKR